MIGAALLVQLAIWITAVRAFYIWHPQAPCQEPGCENKPSRRDEVPALAAPAERRERAGAVTFKLVQRTPDVSSGTLPARLGCGDADGCPQTDEPANLRAARSAARLIRKYSPLDPLGRHRQLARREKFKVVPAVAPTVPNAVGVLQDGTDFSYFVEVGFGSAAKPLYMLLDTGAGTTWVMGSSCKSKACGMHSSYGPEDSKTYRENPKEFSISYGSGNVSGVLAADTLSIAGLKLDMTFGVATGTSDDFTNFPFDGILGLSLAKGTTDNFMDVVKKQNLVKSNIFGVALNRASDGPNTGEVTFGTTNPAKYAGDISYTAVKESAHGDWAVPMDDMSYDGKKAGLGGSLAYVDTGTTYVFGPPANVSALHRQIPGAKSDDGVMWKVPCADAKPLEVSFSGVSYSISPKDWLSGAGGSGDCTSNIVGFEVVKDQWLFGDVFLKNVYAVFDMDQRRLGAFTPPPFPKTTANQEPQDSPSGPPCRPRPPRGRGRRARRRPASRRWSRPCRPSRPSRAPAARRPPSPTRRGPRPRRRRASSSGAASSCASS